MATSKAGQTETHASGLWDHPVRLFVITFLLLALGWIGLVGSLHAHEMIVGLAVVLLSSAFCSLIYRSEMLPFDLRLRDVAQGWRVPGYVVTKCAQITWVLAQDLAGRPADSVFRVCGFRGGSHNPYDIERMVLAVVYSTAAPNFIVIGIDPHQNHMLFHQIRRTPVSKMTQALGAQQ